MTVRPIRVFFHLSFLTAFLALHLTVASATPAADYSHARVVRLSLVQGEVKVSRTGGTADSLGQNLGWEQAMINLPIREGFVLATGQGRTEVEFESGAAAYLAENSVLQFTELALSDGARITKLTLTQGTATIYANPSREDAFVIKTPTLEVALTKKGRIRVDTYDDGVTVSALRGEAEVTSSAGSTHVSKGQSLSLRADNPNATISSIPKDDDWDRWVADREETVQSTTAAASNRINSPYYNAGVADLSTYGTWISYGGYDNCWRPLGVNYAWTPFSSGRWSFYPGFGWTWVSSEPWGWLPYHFGGWVFSPVYGWLWVPGHTQQWRFGFRPATAVFVQSNNRVGWIPMHPLDRRGDKPLNMEHGLVTQTGPGSLVHVPVTPAERIQVLRDAPRGLQAGEVHSAAPPQRISRRLDGDEDRNAAGAPGAGIVYDRRERRFVNANPDAGANPADKTNINVNHQDNRPSVAGAPNDRRDAPASSVAPNPAVMTVTPSRPVGRDEQTAQPAAAPQVGSQLSIDRARRMNRDNTDSFDHDKGDAPRSMVRPQPPSAPPSTSHEAAPMRVNPPPTPVAPRTEPRPIPPRFEPHTEPRVESSHPAQPAAAPMPRYSPPPTAPAAPRYSPPSMPRQEPSQNQQGRGHQNPH